MARKVALASSYAPPVNATRQAAARAAFSIVTSGCSSSRRSSRLPPAELRDVGDNLPESSDRFSESLQTAAGSIVTALVGCALT